MINAKNTAIITYANKNSEENLEIDFLKSLYTVAHYTGKVIILNYGISENAINRIKKMYPVQIVDCCIKTDIFVDRYRDIASEIENLDNDISTIITMDCGDVWFQSSLEIMQNIGIDEIWTVMENRIWDEDEWALKCINNLVDKDKEYVIEKLTGTNVRNSGVIVGGKNAIKKLSKKVYHDILNCGYFYFGIDQIFVNYEIAKLDVDKRRSLDEIFNYVLISNQGQFYIIDNVVYRNDGNKIVIVHNAGGNWRLLKRPFTNKWHDTNQYIIENIKKISEEV